MAISKILQANDHAIISCSPTNSVQQAAKLLAEKRIGALPVLDGTKVAGIFSERDLLYCLAREGGDVLARAVAEVMTSPVISITSDTNVLAALSLMTKRRIRHLPVVDDGVMVGFISIGDLVKYRMVQVETEAEQMRDYITTA